MTRISLIFQFGSAITLIIRRYADSLIQGRVDSFPVPLDP